MTTTSVVLPPKPPWVLIGLDTTGPELDILAPGVIQPPDVLEALVSADEPVLDWTAYFTDQGASVYPLGVEVLDDRNVRILLATTSIGSGRGTLVVIARDLAGNTGSLSWTLLVDRPRAYDIDTDVFGAFAVTASPDQAYEVETDAEHAFGVSATRQNAWDASTDVRHAFDTETEMSNG